MNAPVQLPQVAPRGHIFRIARLVRFGERPAPVLIPGQPWFEQRDPALQQAGNVPGSVVVLVRIPQALQEEP